MKLFRWPFQIDSDSKKYRDIEMRFCKELAKHRAPELTSDSNTTTTVPALLTAISGLS